MQKIRSRAARTLLPPKEQMLAQAIAEGIGTEIRLAALDAARARYEVTGNADDLDALHVAQAAADPQRRTYAEAL